MIRVVVFDLDGVLVDADKLHFNALNDALHDVGAPPITWSEHLSIYKGVPTTKKVKILTERKQLSPSAWGTVCKQKQKHTLSMIAESIVPDFEKVAMLRKLQQSYRIAVCSNAKRESVVALLKAAQLIDYCDIWIGNDDIKDPKPSPEIFLRAMSLFHASPEECCIIEDSDVGRQAARASGAFVVPVKGPEEVNYYRIATAIQDAETPNIIIPAAGQGKRFSEAGYLYPKPLIDVQGQPMIELVLNNFSGLGHPIVLLQKDHCDQYCADTLIKQLSPGSEVVKIDGQTEGAVCTVLAAEREINSQKELIIANSDQYLDYDLSSFINAMRVKQADGGILTFYAQESKWSYAAVGADGCVARVAEKEVISPHATVGIYYFRKGSDFVKAARRMIEKDIRVNNEFYVCPVFNEIISAGGKVLIHEIDRSLMHGLGTPEDLKSFISRKQETRIIELECHTEKLAEIPSLQPELLKDLQ